MKVNNKNYQTVWLKDASVFMIEQNLLPFEFKIFESKNYLQTCQAIKTMIIRGAGAIGATAGFAMAQASIESANLNKKENFSFLNKALKNIHSTRPTAQNLFMASDRVFQKALISPQEAILEAQKIANEDAMACKKIGEFGNTLIKPNYKIATHCNAGWLAFVDYGSALSPVYEANKQGKNIFVWVDETRPRSQGARLTAWELRNENVNHKIIADNATAYLMSVDQIDMVITGADRIAANGDTANKIGTLEKAIAAKYYGIPFYIAAPTSTFDFKMATGKDIKIEERSQDEVLYQTGLNSKNILEKILVASPNSEAFNPAFDVTPAELITGFITEKGIFNHIPPELFDSVA